MNANVASSMIKGIKLFEDMDKLEKKFYTTLEEKNIKIESYNDIERIEVLFNKTLKEILQDIKKSSFDNEEKKILEIRVILDMHGRFAEKFNLDPMMVPQYLGQYNIDIFNKAVEDFKQLSF